MSVPAITLNNGVQIPTLGFGVFQTPPDETAVAVEEGLAQLHLQRAHVAAEHRLRHAQHAGGAREAAEVGDVHEVVELFQIHGAHGMPDRHFS